MESELFGALRAQKETSGTPRGSDFEVGLAIQFAFQHLANDFIKAALWEGGCEKWRGAQTGMLQKLGVWRASSSEADGGAEGEWGDAGRA